MRTLHLNLASKPYRNYRPVWAVAAAMAVLSAVLLFLNVHTAYRYFVETERTRAEIDRLNRESNEETRIARQIYGDLQRFDRKTLNTQSTFINQQIVERAFSWSELLDLLEQLVPSDVRIVSLNPSTEDGITRLRLQCMAKSPYGLVELLRRLQQDPRFDNPVPRSEGELDNGLYQFDIETEYRPQGGGELLP